MPLSSDDRIGIEETMARYAWAMADKDWAAWRATLTPDATVDYTTAGGVAGTADEALEWLQGALGAFDVTASMIVNLVVEDHDADSATTRSLYRMVMRLPGDEPTYLEASGWYRDRMVRTPDGWRIADRFEQMLYLRGA
jgi:3-phenylpropionate/cinnamic acid dioxygenase small subunit